jgi:cytidylate kinase
MSATSALERYLESEKHETRRPDESRLYRPPVYHPMITISRQAGAGAHVVTPELVARLQARTPEGSPPWTVFDRSLVERVLKDHELPDRLAELMPEDRISGIADTLDELFGLHPSTWTLVRKTAETILRLAEIGNVVVIGRGANLITANLASAFHARLVGSVPRRVAHVEEHLHVGPQAAAEYVRERDLGRKRYVRKYYGKDIDDPLLYHLVINTDRVSYVEAARMIAEAIVGHQDMSERVGAGPASRAVARLP